MVIQDKKTKQIRLYGDLIKLNDACIAYFFPTPYIDEVLESVGGHEAYSFMDGFSGYHQIKMAKEDQHK